jgi:two-component system response regulator RegX3
VCPEREDRPSPASWRTPEVKNQSSISPSSPVNESSALILVIEDEESYREALLAGLTREGYRVELASDGIDGLRRFVDHKPDLVLLDLLLPGMSGVEVCRRMRGMAQIPIIMVSALDSETDIVLGLELGAEDYIAKPYRLRELVARIRSVLRRVSPPSHAFPGDAPAQPPRVETIVSGPFQVNFARRVVTAKGEPIHLSRREFDLLALLLSPAGQVRTREELIDKLWSGRDLTDTRTLDTHVRRLRVKLEPDPANPRYLVTVRGVGFRFEIEGGDQPLAASI